MVKNSSEMFQTKNFFHWKSYLVVLGKMLPGKMPPGMPLLIEFPVLSDHENNVIQKSNK